MWTGMFLAPVTFDVVLVSSKLYMEMRDTMFIGCFERWQESGKINHKVRFYEPSSQILPCVGSVAQRGYVIHYIQTL